MMFFLLLIYIAFSILFVWLVGQSLHRNGRVFLIESFGHNVQVADSVNHLLLVGFYLLNLGYILFTARTAAPISSLEGGLEFLCSKLGLAVAVLGAMHFLNMALIVRMGQQISRIFAPVAAKVANAQP